MSRYFLILLVIAIGISFYFLQGKSVNTAPDVSANATTTPETAQTRVVPDGWREYRNTAYRFSFFYPEDLEVKEYPEAGNAITVTFQNGKKQKGFQLFIVPYQEPQVSDERFKQDIPSGVRANMTDTMVD